MLLLSFIGTTPVILGSMVDIIILNVYEHGDGMQCSHDGDFLGSVMKEKLLSNFQLGILTETVTDITKQRGPWENKVHCIPSSGLGFLL